MRNLPGAQEPASNDVAESRLQLTGQKVIPLKEKLMDESDKLIEDRRSGIELVVQNKRDEKV